VKVKNWYIFIISIYLDIEICYNFIN
jgi:hypothetical protein